MSDPRDDLFDFPCAFPIKAMGRATPGFQAHVMSIISRYAPGFNEDDVSIRLSRGEKYLSVTIRITARSRQQLDDIYRALQADDRILGTL